MAKFDIMVWYTEEEYGKAWTTVEAETEEEARAILDKAFEDGEEYELEWEYHAKGGSGTEFDRHVEEPMCIERKDNDC